jgi:rod shape-determining protein MreC
VVLALGLLLLSAVLGVWQAHARRTGHTASIDALLVELTAPAARAASAARDTVTGEVPGTLTTQIGLDTYTRLQAENHQLRAALKLRDALPQKPVAAEVIGRVATANPWQVSLRLGKGSRDGVEKDMVALTPDGVLGKVQAVTAHTADVLPIMARDGTDRTDGVGARTRRSRVWGLLKGAGDGLCVMGNLPTGADVHPGDIIETGNVSLIYPEGLTLGTVLSVSDDRARSERKAIVKPAVDPARVMVVVVVK